MSDNIRAPNGATAIPEPSLNRLDIEVQRNLMYTLGHFGDVLDRDYIYRALAIAVRNRLIKTWNSTRRATREHASKRVYYLSLEFLIGRSMSNAILNLDLDDEARQAVHDYGVRLEEIEDREHDAGLGNGGLGRLAACFLDSCANLQLPVMGYGIRYQYGMFYQRIEDGRQIEQPDRWLRAGNPWEIERPEKSQRVSFYGHTERYRDSQGVERVRWSGTQDVLAVPYDMPIPGYRNDTVNTLRLWQSAATDDFNLEEFNFGSYTEAVAAKNLAEQITMVLYPNDASENGKELRLKQQYFLTSASLQDVLTDWVTQHGSDFSEFGERHCFQLNDTHPACAVPELMRQLIDLHGLDWDEAWRITQQSMAYTNHTLLPEALERWSVALFSRLLPRLIEIIYEINSRFLAEVQRKWPNDHERCQRMSLIEEGSDPHVRMAFLAIVGSSSVNGVAKLHTDLLKDGLFSDFNELWPGKINNKTNGVTQRRWLAHCNPQLRDLLNESIGDAWITDLSAIEQLKPLAQDSAFRERWRQVKRANKLRLIDYVEKETGTRFQPDSLFDVQVKRIHEYKRQLLNVLHVIHMFDRIRSGDTDGLVPRCVLFGGKAAPGYHVAKVIVKLINDVARIVNEDPACRDLLKMVFLPNYCVSAMEIICPATELSEQISTAGKEASGTGNMKFMMNGALTIGTLDGANIEIRERCGAENFFLFGLDAGGVAETRRNYDPNAIIAGDSDIKRVMGLLEGGQFNSSDPGLFAGLAASLRSPQDPWLTIADFRSYIEAQKIVNSAYRRPEHWNEMSILNTASCGWFSSDRTIQQYADLIWKVNALKD